MSTNPDTQPPATALSAAKEICLDYSIDGNSPEDDARVVESVAAIIARHLSAEQQALREELAEAYSKQAGLEEGVEVYSERAVNAEAHAAELAAALEAIAEETQCYETGSCPYSADSYLPEKFKEQIRTVLAAYEQHAARVAGQKGGQ